MSGDGPGSKLDPRVSHILRRMAVLLGKTDRMDKFYSAFNGDENTSKSVMRFVEDPTAGCCFFFPEC